MKFVIASSPFVGHLNPLLQIAGLLRNRGHEIIVHTATFLKDRAAGLDARFVPLHGIADYDSRDIAAVFPEHDHLTPGVEPGDAGPRSDQVLQAGTGGPGNRGTGR